MSRTTLAAVAMLLLAACGSEEGPGGVTPDPDALQGRTFVSTAVTKDGADAPLVAGSSIRLTFEDGRLSATAGCNGMGADAEVADGVLRLSGGLATTMMGCPEPLMAQDAWLAELLEGEPTVAVEGTTMTLTGSGRVVTLVDSEVAEPDLPLEGTVWTLDSLSTGTGPDAAVSSVPQGVVSTLTLEARRLVLSPGCNTGSAPVEVDGSTITVGGVALTRKACQGAPGEVENAVLAALSGTLEWSVSADLLTLAGPGGTLTYRGERTP